MKNKILFGCVSVLFVAATAFNIGLLQTKDANDVSLDAITIMAQAHDGETGGYSYLCTSGGPGSISCSTSFNAGGGGISGGTGCTFAFYCFLNILFKLSYL